jgi:hypothetical protein
MTIICAPISRARCETEGCKRMATHTVFNSWDSMNHGEHCREHARKLTMVLHAQEVSVWKGEGAPFAVFSYDSLPLFGGGSDADVSTDGTA